MLLAPAGWMRLHSAEMGAPGMAVGHGRRSRSVTLFCGIVVLAGAGLPTSAPAQADAFDSLPGRSGTVARQSLGSLVEATATKTSRPRDAARAPLAPRRPALTRTGGVLEALTAFEGTSYASDTVQLTPPDTQVAVGPVYVAETVNSALSVWTREGDPVSTTDLNAHFFVPNGFQFVDPRIVYDTMSQRWFLSGFASNPSSDSRVYVGVSDSADPTGHWATYLLATTTGTFTDQPRIGVSSDKVVISWDDYTNSRTVFGGQETWVLHKADLLAGARVNYYQFFPDVTRSSVVPATSLSTTATEYLVYNNTCSRVAGTGSGSCTAGTPSLGLVEITGTPTAGTVAWNELDPAITPTASPPPAAQPGGPTIETNDDRLLSAVWQNGKLWTTANDACDAGGTTRACLRVIEVTTGSSPTVLLDTDLRRDGHDLYYPAVTLDGSGNPFIVATVSSATVPASVIAYGRSPTSGGFVSTYVWHGTGTYACSFCTRNRWGDYSGAAIDPVDPDSVWVAGEHATAIGVDNWATAIGRLTFAAPRVTSVSPTRGSARGGTRVTVRGANFTDGSIVRFGAARGTAVSVESSSLLSATAPAGRAGKIDVTVTTANGTSARLPADKFTYIEPERGPVPGYWMVGATGTVYPFGGARSFGDASGPGVVHIEAGANRQSYWIVNGAGRVFAIGRARWFGDAGALFAGERIISLSGTPAGNGYWLFTTLGRVLPFGAARFYGDMSRVALNGPIIGSVATPTGRGYYMVASDGGIFTFGDARFFGSMGGRHLNQPVNGLVTTADNRGYWLVASDGGIFAFGRAPFLGSVGDRPLNRPVIGMVRYGDGYLMVGSDGGVFNFSNRRFAGSLGSRPPAIPIVGIAATPGP